MKFTARSVILSASVFPVALAMGADNLLNNASFETGTWGGTASFVLPNNATAINNSVETIGGWLSEAGFWVEDASRSPEGNRFAWIRESGGCISQAVSIGTQANQLQGGKQYQICFDFIGFDPDNPNGTVQFTETPFVEFHWVYPSSPLGEIPGGRYEDFYSPTSEPLTVPQPYQSWSSLLDTGDGWQRACFDFTLTNDIPAEAVGLYVSFSHSASGGLGDPVGIGFDNVSLMAVPEPGSLALVGLGAGALLRRRRR